MSRPPCDYTSGALRTRVRRAARSVSESLEQLARIGGGDSGVTRLAWSKELFEAYEWVAAQMRELGLTVEIDAAGNLIGRWEVGTGSPLIVGSHLDTVPQGGAFDGALGVVAAVHAVRRLQEKNIEPERPLWIVAFMDEEGARFGSALFGSLAFTGGAVSRFADRRDEHGVSLREAMTEAGFDFDVVGSACRIGDMGAYLELHIEQGPVLEVESVDIGIVTSIVGLRGYRVLFRGEANHAGTTPMRLRRDALAGAARVALALRDYAREREGVTANVGKITVEPGGANVVPGLADFTIDVRATTAAAIRELETYVENLVRAVAADEELESELGLIFEFDPLQLDARLVDVIGSAAAEVGASWRKMPSGAGHDALLVGQHIPAGMIFVPSRNGISHSAEEHSSREQVELGMRVLTSAMRHCLRTAG